MIVIGLSGNIGAGKDTVADILVDAYGFTRMSFAGAVKRLVRELDPLVGVDIYQDCLCGDDGCAPIHEDVTVQDLYDLGYTDETIKESPWYPEVRRLWQRFGTDVMRKHDPDFWVNLALDELGQQSSERVVFTDVRFPNEAAMIQSLEGPFFSDGDLTFSKIRSSVWRITRSVDDDLEVGSHESEAYAGLMDEEVTIVNDASLEELAEAVGIAMGFVEDIENPYEQFPLWEESFEH